VFGISIYSLLAVYINDIPAGTCFRKGFFSLGTIVEGYRMLGKYSSDILFDFSILGGVSPLSCPSPVFYAFRAYLLASVGLQHSNSPPKMPRRIVYLSRNIPAQDDGRKFFAREEVR
jgi:hypothetical protein